MLARHQPAHAAEVLAPGPSRSSRRRGGCRGRRESAPASSACSRRCWRPGWRRSCRPCARTPRARPWSARRCRAATSTRPESTSWSTIFSPRPSMSSARRPAKWRIANLRCAAQNRPPLQRWSTAALLAHDVAGAHRARGAACGSSARSRARRPGMRPTTSGMTSPARRTITSVADANALPAHLEQVVQGRVRDRRAADEDRLELGHRRQLAGAADLDLDRVERRRPLLRRILLRHRPARLARLEAELVLQGAVVDLVDDAVDLVRQGVALRRDRRRGTRPARRRRRRARASGSPAGRSRRTRRAAPVCVAGTRQPTTSPRP